MTALQEENRRLGTHSHKLQEEREKQAKVCFLFRTLSSLRGLRGAPAVPPLCRETSVSRTANVGTVGKNWLRMQEEREKAAKVCF